MSEARRYTRERHTAAAEGDVAVSDLRCKLPDAVESPDPYPAPVRISRLSPRPGHGVRPLEFTESEPILSTTVPFCPMFASVLWRESVLASFFYR